MNKSKFTGFTGSMVHIQICDQANANFLVNISEVNVIALYNRVLT